MIDLFFWPFIEISLFFNTLFLDNYARGFPIYLFSPIPRTVSHGSARNRRPLRTPSRRIFRPVCSFPLFCSRDRPPERPAIYVIPLASFTRDPGDSTRPYSIFVWPVVCDKVAFTMCSVKNILMDREEAICAVFYPQVSLKVSRWALHSI